MKKGVKEIYKVLIPIANGSEEMEVITIFDTLVRAGSNVTLASIENNLQVTFSLFLFQLFFKSNFISSLFSFLFY